MVISQKKSIQKKLLAATSMLLVACIMLISASYAWFTLSTAPEITGITTTVGANGNLEIALADDSTWSDPDSLVKTNVGSSLVSGLEGDAVKNVNITWGNLVDVSKYYGLEGVTLLPSRLNLNGNKVSAIPLLTPSYGTDGRVADLLENTDYATYLSSGVYQLVNEVNGVRDGRGVSIIGAASGMTDRQLAYRSAKVALANAVADAQSAAKASLESNGTPLANIVMQKAISDNVLYGQDELNTIKNVLSGVTEAQEALLTAWESAVISYAASAEGEKLEGLTTEDNYLDFKEAIEGDKYTVNTTTSTATGEGGATITTVTGTITVNSVTIELPGDFAAYYDKVVEVGNNITASDNKVSTLEQTLATRIGQAEEGTEVGLTWEELKTALDYIVDAQYVTVNGYGSSDIKANLGKIVSAVAGGSGIQVQMPSGAGVYADVADFCGNYSATVYLKNLSYGDIVLDEDVKATMTTTSTITPYYTTATSVVNGAGAPKGTGAANNKLSDMFGYSLDFYLRTNAANANLLLQVAEAQRIYTDSTNEDTQGGGSNMTFTSSDSNYTATQMVQLMDAIRVVFTDGDGNILKVAKLDTDKAIIANSTVKADLKICNYEITTVAGTDISMLTLVDANKETTAFDFPESQQITGMTQNQAMKLSVMVYLDGDYVTNAMVANAAKSMTGTMNLQFATDAKLVPMDDTTLKGVTTGGTTTDGTTTGGSTSGDDTTGGTTTP